MDTLRAHIEDLVMRGELPKDDCLATWYGHGQGQPCSACQKRILGTQPSVECDTVDGGTVAFHADCYRVWRAVIVGE